ADVRTRANAIGPARSRVLDASSAKAKIDTPDSGTLVLTQSDAPGWHVAIDGREAPVLRALDAFRAVFVPAGAHEIVWSYRPRSILLGGTVTLLALAAWVMSTWFVKRRAHENFF